MHADSGTCQTRDQLHLGINRPPDMSALQKIIFSCFSTKTCVGTQKNRLDETVLLSTQNTCLN